MKRFDAIIIGTGQAGPSLAARFAGVGKRVDGNYSDQQMHAALVTNLSHCVAAIVSKQKVVDAISSVRALGMTAAQR